MPAGSLNSMGLFSKLKRHKIKDHGSSQGNRGVSSSATLAADPVAASTTPVLTSGSSRSSPSTVVTAQPPPEQVVSTALQPLNSTAASPAADTASSQDVVDLWNRAYEIFQNREPELMADYKRHLASLRDGRKGSIDLSGPQPVEAIVNQLLEDREKKQWRVSLLGKDIRIREQAERLTKFLLWSDTLVKDALSAQPYAALAWSGVMVLLPLLTSGNAQNEAMLKGFNSICDVQVYWDTCEKAYLGSSYREVYQDLIEPLAELYSYILEYQSLVICHLSKSQLSRAWQNVAGWNDWAGKVGDIDGRSKRCNKRIPHQKEKEIRERWNRQLQEMQQSRTILNEIQWILEEGRKQAKQNYEDEKERDLLRDLASDYEGFKNFNLQKVPGTCEWFFNDDRFRKWRDSNTSSLLWVSAGPGCGKSVLSRALIDEHRLSTNFTTSTICHFFFKDGDEHRMHSANALSAILHQLFTQDPRRSLMGSALPSHKNFGKGLAQKFYELWQILDECARSSEAGEIICILDALDECNADGRRQIIHKLKEFYFKQDERSSSPSKLKFLITSRPYDDLEDYFRKFANTTAYLHFDGDDKSEQIGREINLVIDARVEEIAISFAEEDRRKISKRLKSMEHRTYLWLYLTLDIIEQSPSAYGRLFQVEKLLSKLPSQVSEAYEKILKRSTDEAQTEILLQIVLAATRPLTLDEVNSALTLALQEQKFTSNAELMLQQWPIKNFASVVKNLCGLFVNIYDSKLSFIHQTAREFLTAPERKGIWKGRLNISKSHSTISQSCLQYLLLPDIKMPVEDDSTKKDYPIWEYNFVEEDSIEKDYPLGEYKFVEEDSTGEECSTKMEHFPFLPYAASYWHLHYISQEAAVANKSRKDARILCDTANQMHLWAPSYFKQRGMIGWRGWTDLALASFLGLNFVVNDILFIEKADINAESEDHGTALQAASGGGQRDIVQILLDNGANVNARGRGYTALEQASARGYEEIVQILLDKGADINDSANVNQLLLDKGADVNIKGNLYDTPLQVAVVGRHQKVAQILLDKGADVNAEGGLYGTALQVASSCGYQEVVQMLLDKGANINGYSYFNKKTPLEVASKAGYQGIVQMLLDKGADVNNQGGGRNTALLVASVEGHQEIVQMLLDKGADINVEGLFFGTALQEASSRGYYEIVQMLLDKGADINVYSYRKNQTPLEIASKRGYQSIVQILLDNGADVNNQREGYGTALQLASAEGHQEVVQILLDNGADFNAHGGEHGTALQAASAGGH